MTGKSTDRATEFSKDLRRCLQDSHGAFNRALGDLKWHVNWKPRGISRESVDVVGVNGRGREVILIEAELLREDPASNVVKIWKWATEGKLRKHILFVQSFSKAYLNKKRERRARASFVAKRMVKELPSILYKEVRLNYNPRPGGKVGAGRRRHHSQNLAASVVRLGKALIHSR